MKVKSSINSFVGTLFLLGGTRSHKAKRPPLELVRVGCGKLLGAGGILGLADHAVRLLDLLTERVLESVPNQVNGQVGHVDADPASVQTMGDGDRCAAATERIEHSVTLVAARKHDPLQK